MNHKKLTTRELEQFIYRYWSKTSICLHSKHQKKFEVCLSEISASLRTKPNKNGVCDLSDKINSPSLLRSALFQKKKKIERSIYNWVYSYLDQIIYSLKSNLDLGPTLTKDLGSRILPGQLDSPSNSCHKRSSCWVHSLTYLTHLIMHIIKLC